MEQSKSTPISYGFMDPQTNTFYEFPDFETYKQFMAWLELSNQNSNNIVLETPTDEQVIRDY